MLIKSACHKIYDRDHELLTWVLDTWHEWLQSDNTGSRNVSYLFKLI